jgi:hypothetical protein
MVLAVGMAFLASADTAALPGTTERVRVDSVSSQGGDLGLRSTIGADGGVYPRIGDDFPLATAISAVPPANDDFADAQVMPPMDDERNTTGATLEAGEPRPCGAMGSTVWYRWVPSEGGRWEASTAGSDYNTALAVYTGTSMADLNLVQCNDNASYLQSVVTFDAVAGETYYFQVGGNLGETALLHLGLGNMCPPVIPGTYNGTVTINGNPAPNGTLVRASIQGWECSTDTTSGGRYVLDCPDSLPIDPPCFRRGWLSFEAGGTACTPTVEFRSGLSDVNLQCPAGDTEADGFTDAREIYLGTDPLDACPDVLGSPGLCPGPICDGDDVWPPDINIDTWASILDVLLFKPVIMSQVGDPNYAPRYDFNVDERISILDVLLYKPVIMTQCTNP